MSSPKYKVGDVIVFNNNRGTFVIQEVGKVKYYGEYTDTHGPYIYTRWQMFFVDLDDNPYVTVNKYKNGMLKSGGNI